MVLGFFVWLFVVLYPSFYVVPLFMAVGPVCVCGQSWGRGLAGGCASHPFARCSFEGLLLVLATVLGGLHFSGVLGPFRPGRLWGVVRWV